LASNFEENDDLLPGIQRHSCQPLNNISNLFPWFSVLPFTRNLDIVRWLVGYRMLSRPSAYR
jgi:hypothetical protein